MADPILRERESSELRWRQPQLQALPEQMSGQIPPGQQPQRSSE